jgi:hypothetical protein
MNRLIIAGIALALTVTAGCSDHNDKRGRGDAPVGTRDDSPARIINMPDQFANLAVKCDRGNGIYVTTRDAAPTIIPNDPNCTKGAR